mgnify:CR=1 FL=1
MTKFIKSAAKLRFFFDMCKKIVTFAAKFTIHQEYAQDFSFDGRNDGQLDEPHGSGQRLRSTLHCVL